MIFISAMSRTVNSTAKSQKVSCTEPALIFVTAEIVGIKS